MCYVKPVLLAIKQITSYELQQKKVKKKVKCVIEHVFGTFEQGQGFKSFAECQKKVLRT